MAALLALGTLTLQAKEDGTAVTGHFTVKTVARNAVRIQYAAGTSVHSTTPDWAYVSNETVESDQIKVDIDEQQGRIDVRNQDGQVVFSATSHSLRATTVDGEPTYEATLSIASPKDEYLFGLGQFQDDYSNVRGLPRRLTQVNTQIAIPMIISNKSYGVLWNNYGLTEFNPCDQHVKLDKQLGAGQLEVVNVTSTEGGKQEVRQRHFFAATIEVKTDGDYALLLDVGQKMARRHNLCIDGETVIEMQNLWLPPTASTIVHLKKGKHQLSAELNDGDQPTVYYNKVEDKTTFRSPVADAVDYTVFIGTPDEIIATYRKLTGAAPKMPSWALGYIHCRERFHSQEELLSTATRFHQEQLPVDMMVQDWQYWGKYGWNSMQFDEDNYPDPKAMTDSLHRMGMRLMVSVWSKIDKNSQVGKEMEQGNYYIPGTDWIDFFNPEAAAAYWKNFRERLLPLGIDAWWQDATEPENDDLAGRRVNGDQWSGERVRNVYPLLVCKTVYEGLQAAGREPMILTRSGFPGIQRYNAALWSGDVGNDWETFRRQIAGGLGLQAAGIPWWTYDAGGFFRPNDQYTNQDYIERMLRWIETSVYLPLMRVHGYISNTEPWNYGPETEAIIANCLKEREQLKPYIDSCAVAVAEKGYTLMRPLVFDFADDPEALKQKYEYMFGPELLISPVTEPGVTEWKTYLPKNAGGWSDYRTGRHYAGGQYVTTPVTKAYIPVFRRIKTNACPTANMTSPNGKLSLTSKDGGLTVYYGDRQVLEIPTIGFEGIDIKPELSFSQKISADYQMLAGKRLHCTNEANEYRNDQLVVRLYNDGVAFRYELPELAGQQPPKEQTTYRIAEGTKRWMMQWTDAYEGFYPLTTTAKVKPIPHFANAVVSPEGYNLRWGYPMLVEPVDGIFTLLSEANIEPRQSASCLYTDGELFRVTPDVNEQPVNGAWHTPWRVAIIGSLGDVVQSTLITDVAEPCQLADTSWIQPGVVSWIYWAYNHGSNDYDIIKKYVDMAVTLHLPYVLIDAEWDEMKDGKTIEDAVAYARSKGVKPMIWYNSSVGWVDGAPGPKFRLNKPEDREKEFAWCEKIGVAGVKIDFFSGDSQRDMTYCIDLLKCAAKHHLLVNFHGATVPRGWQRTYPNLLSTEGVYGAEWYNNVPTFTTRAASHNSTLPFTRNVIGPMDYTPCTFSDSQHPHITSRAHELALTVLYESGLQHLADKPESYLAQPEAVQQFLSRLPAVWDETRYVSGYPGESAVLARRSGNTWYVAGINGADEAKTLSVDLSFLGTQQRKVQIFADNADGDWQITTATALPSQMACQLRGGFVLIISTPI